MAKDHRISTAALAAHLGCHRKTILRLIDKLGIEPGWTRQGRYRRLDKEQALAIQADWESRHGWKLP